MLSLQWHHYLVPVLALAIIPCAVHSHQIVILAKLVMEAVIVDMIAMEVTLMTAVWMLPALEVSICMSIDINFCHVCNHYEYRNFSNNIIIVITHYYYSADPRMCADVGIYGCCNSTSLGACEVRDGQYSCACDISCHTRGDCCPDACPRKLNFTVNPCSSCCIMHIMYRNNIQDCACILIIISR
jgi:hypothetical protein